MRCPTCGTYQPAQLERCFLCGEEIMPPKANRLKENQAEPVARARQPASFKPIFKV